MSIRKLEIDDQAWPEVLRIFEATIPSVERCTSAELVEASREGSHWVFSTSPEVSGYAVVETFPGANFALLAYLGVDKHARRRGLGSLLLEKVKEAVALEGLEWLLIEREPVTTQTHPDFGDPVARARFYGRKGTLVLSEQYEVPDFTDPNRIVPLALLGLPLQPAPSVDLKAWVKTLWIHAYDANPDDPRLASLLVKL